MPDTSLDAGFGTFALFVLLFIAAVFALVIFTIVRAVARKAENDRKPVLTVTATCVAKRADVSSHLSGPGPTADAHAMSSRRTSTSYFATFQLADGTRMELEMDGQDYGLLAEGDQGRLTYQGWAYKGFVRGL